MSDEHQGIRLKLPPHAADGDQQLHAVAVRILHCAEVRSITVNATRSVAIVRLSSTTINRPVVSEVASRMLEVAAEFPGHISETAVELIRWVDPGDDSISFVKPPEPVRGWRRAVYPALGLIALLIGAVGIVMPGLPTTPFVLLASFFFVRSSTRLHERLITSRVFGGLLRDWYVHRGVRPHIRARALAVVAIVVAASLAVARPPLPALVLIVALAACGLYVVWRLPAIREAAAGNWSENLPS
jgi:uncharacterized membrane protein YbaN (DUF454 family)